MKFSALGAALLALGLLAGPALADDAAPPAPAPAPTPAATLPPPSAEQMELSRKILIAVGLKASMDQIVPAMASQLQAQLLQIHPEMAKPLHETLLALLPEFQQGEGTVFDDSARALALHLSTTELQQTLTYFQSPAGYKYTGAQADILDALGASGAAWRQKLTDVMLERTRDEMKKKGFTF